jgi:hypothetical protein
MYAGFPPAAGDSVDFHRARRYSGCMRWLFFSYSLPAHPSKARVYVWRQLKKLGAVNYQSTWILPHSAERINELNKLREEILRYKGESLIIGGKSLSEDQEERIQRAFIDSRNEEYQELIKKCDDYFREIESEIESKNFIFAEVEENEEELEKLKQWFRKVEKRDTLEVPLRKVALGKIKNCEKVFDAFARQVYEYIQSKKEVRTGMPGNRRKGRGERRSSGQA